GAVVLTRGPTGSWSSDQSVDAAILRVDAAILRFGSPGVAAHPRRTTPRDRWADALGCRGRGRAGGLVALLLLLGQPLGLLGREVGRVQAGGVAWPGHGPVPSGPGSAGAARPG